jgi:hypothetical protein
VHACPTVKATQTALDEEISRTIGAAPNVVEDVSPLRDEKAGDPAFIIWEKPEPGHDEPVEASLNQLIYWVTHQEEGRNTAELISALCLTISSYASSKIFLAKLKDRWSQIDPAAPTGDELLFVKLFKEWIRGSLDDLEPQILDEASQFVEKELMKEPKCARLVGKLFDRRADASLNRLAQLEKNAPKVELGSLAQGDGSNLWTGKFSLLDLPIEELGRQLTVWSSTRYYAIKRCELLDCAWDKPRLRYRAPNVIALTQHYNRLSQWVELMILSEKNQKVRLEKMDALADLANWLFEKQNFYDGMGVLSGFDANSVFRMNAHMELLKPSTKEMLARLRELTVPAGNFKELRAKYDQALTNSTPAMPYIGVLLSDLFKYYDATQTFVNGLINVRKCKGVYKMIARIEEFCRDKYCFLPIDQVQAKIDALQDYDEDTLMAMSFEIEKEDGTILNEDAPAGD